MGREGLEKKTTTMEESSLLLGENKTVDERQIHDFTGIKRTVPTASSDLSWTVSIRYL